MAPLYKTKEEKIINTHLNDYCKSIYDTFFYRNLNSFMFLLYDTMDILVDKDIKYSSGNIQLFDLLNPEFCKPSIYLPLFESIEIVRRYLKANVEEYLELIKLTKKLINYYKFNFFLFLSKHKIYW